MYKSVYYDSGFLTKMSGGIKLQNFSTALFVSASLSLSIVTLALWSLKVEYLKLLW